MVMAGAMRRARREAFLPRDWTLPQLVNALRDQPHLQLLYSQSGGLLAWGTAPQRLHAPEAMPVPPAAEAARTSSRHWPTAMRGGALLQAPYEWCQQPYHADQDAGSGHYALLAPRLTTSTAEMAGL